MGALTDTSPTRLTPPLYEVVDPDALDALLSPERAADESAIELSFSYRGYRITVSHDRIVAE